MTTFVIDYETSGLNPYHEDIIEIAIKVYGKDISYESLVIPKSKKPISPKITEITGITNQRLKDDGVSHNVAYRASIDFMKDNMTEGSPAYLIAHNGMGFDFIFFKRLMKDVGESSLDIRYIDSMFYSKYIHPNMYSHSMKTLTKNYNIVNKQEHRAMGDVNALEELVVKMMEKEGITDPTDIYAKLEFL
jgi:DNA polymerase-3 subunit alpha (Gram-positive type)